MAWTLVAFSSLRSPEKDNAIIAWGLTASGPNLQLSCNHWVSWHQASPKCFALRSPALSTSTGEWTRALPHRWQWHFSAQEDHLCTEEDLFKWVCPHQPPSRWLSLFAIRRAPGSSSAQSAFGISDGATRTDASCLHQEMRSFWPRLTCPTRGIGAVLGVNSEPLFGTALDNCPS